MVRQIERKTEDDRPRVLHVTTVPDSLMCFLRGHVLYAKQRELNVQALSSPGELLDEFEHQTGVEVHPVEMSRRITPLRDLISLWRIIGVIKKFRPTIVHGHTPKGGLLAMLAARWCNVPIRIYHIYGLPSMTAQGLKRQLLCTSERTSCRLAHQVYGLCNSLREVVLQEGLCAPEKIAVLNNGNIDGVEAEDRFNPVKVFAAIGQAVREKYNIPQDALVAGYVGRIVRDKGLIELICAWRKLREEFPALHLLVAGVFESKDPLPGDIEATLRNDPRIHLTGFVKDMPPIFRAIDLLILPTYREGFGTVLLEASAMELPVIATRIPGCVDAVQEGVTGLLVPPRDVGALANAIRTYFIDPDMRRRHGVQGRARVLRDFNPEVMRETLYQEYLRLLREFGKNVRAGNGGSSESGSNSQVPTLIPSRRSLTSSDEL